MKKMLSIVIILSASVIHLHSQDNVNKNLYSPEITNEEKIKIDSSFTACPISGDKIVTDILKSVREEFKLPAVGAALITANGIVAIGVAGVQRAGTQDPITLNTNWMINSCTKPMTATLSAIFVKTGKINWNTTIGETFPNLPSNSNPDFKNITLTELLTHHSGIQRELPGLDGSNLSAFFCEWKGEGTLTQQRYALINDISKNKLLYKPGTKFSYSNLDYLIIGAMLEKISGKSYEDLMKEKVFTPLHMDSAGYSNQVVPSHFFTGKPADLYRDSVSNPAGGKTSMQISDWAKFIADQLRGADGKDGLLKADLYKTIQLPMGYKNPDLTLGGWFINNKALYHEGTSGLNFSQMYINTKNGYAVLFCTNIFIDPHNVPKNEDDITVKKAGDKVYMVLGQYYLKNFSK